ncbi:hypothetical protein PR048_001043 [Dryococelus australis]|uniref:Uncharacterized protein n=1 Tax=Dryococelus australis TaxID=614101 RepID=A0ABQ9IGC9_9NEOP|nr:hypothetical protein PR048_001043 [Dryococelus australis]
MDALDRPPLKTDKITLLINKEPILTIIINWAHPGYLLWHFSVIISSSAREYVLKTLCKGHVAIISTKALACSYIWCPAWTLKSSKL